MASGVTKAKGRRSVKNKTYYNIQKHKTRANKIKRILKSQGQVALDLWIKKYPNILTTI